MSGYVRIPCAFMRGGTSKGVILKEIHLPADPCIRDKVILRIFGSPEKRQVDGMGGGTPLTSKLGIVGAPTRPDADINYTFGQVSIEDNKIDYKPTCGNISTAIGLYAAEEGYVALKEPVTTVVIYNTNIDKLIEVDIPVKDGKIQYKGDFSIAGVQGTASRMTVNFVDSGGSITGKLLPTGSVKDQVRLEDGRTFDVSAIDCANLVVFVSAEQLQIAGTELADRFDRKDLHDTLEAIRVEIGLRIGLFTDKSEVTPETHALPKISVVAKPQTYTTTNKEVVQQSDIDVIGRYIAMGTLHQAYAVSGGIAAAACAQIPGTVIYDLLGGQAKDILNIGHPTGIINVESKVEEQAGEYRVVRAALGRTARRIMDGYVYVEEELIYQK